MEKLKYIVDDKTLANLLGVQNFINKEAAILELVKNAYDALAKKIQILYQNKQLIISDDGKGMGGKEIYNDWMNVGRSNKGYTDIKNNERVLAGSKGVGRFALARLGENVTIYSKRNGQKTIKWITDWLSCGLEKNNTDIDIKVGTVIIISNLRDSWTEKTFDNLSKYLSIVYNDDKMEIEIITEKNKYTVHKYFYKPRIGKNYVECIKFQYNNIEQQLKTEIVSDEFQDEAKKYYDDSLVQQVLYNNVVNELDSDNDIDIEKKELEQSLKKLGKFSGELYFSLKNITEDDKESFLYKYSTIPARYEVGVVLYRNAFSISSFEGNKDWIGFGKRARKSPAAATHSTGSWRVRENQLSGKIILDKKENANLKELSNRQGLDEDIYFQLFIKIIDIAIKNFERYRQGIIKKINIKNIKPENTDFDMLDEIVKNPDSIKELSQQEREKFVKEIGQLKDVSKQHEKEQKETESRYKYDVRILNIFASAGLKATSIAHELKNERNEIDGNYDFIVNALKNYNLWEMLNSEERTKYAYKNVPELLKNNDTINRKILGFMDTMLEESEKKNFEPQDIDINETMNKVINRWTKEYIWIKIDFCFDEVIIFHLAEDILMAIFDNLILNSIQQNDENNILEITITVVRQENSIFFSYKDNGIGLVKKYIDQPMKILEVHETSRKEGHGLGMWIVNNTVIMTGGEILSIDGHNGFSIDFTLGSEL